MDGIKFHWRMFIGNQFPMMIKENLMNDTEKHYASVFTHAVENVIIILVVCKSKSEEKIGHNPIFHTHTIVSYEGVGPDCIVCFPENIRSMIVKDGGFYFNSKFVTIRSNNRVARVVMRGETFILY